MNEREWALLALYLTALSREKVRESPFLNRKLENENASLGRIRIEKGLSSCRGTINPPFVCLKNLFPAKAPVITKSNYHT